jgi:hypothetical protein
MSKRKEEQPPEGMNPETAEVWPPRGPDLPEQVQPSPPPLPPTGVPPDVAAQQREEAAKEPPRRDEHGRLTHYGAHKAFDERGSVILNGVHITERHQLPPEEDFAAGNEAAEAALESDIDRRLAALEAQRARLHGRRAARGKKE